MNIKGWGDKDWDLDTKISRNFISRGWMDGWMDGNCNWFKGVLLSEHKN